MAEQIIDGSGSGYKAKVGSDLRLQTRAISEDEGLFNAESGQSYNFNTGYFSINADATLMYLKNNDEKDFVIKAIAVAQADGFTHTNFPSITLVRNPTGGDLISDETAISMSQNRNFGSSNTAQVDVYRGKQGGTLTGGDDIALLQTSKTGRDFFSIDFLLPRGSSIGITMDVTVSGGSANVYCAIIGYFRDGV